MTRSLDKLSKLAIAVASVALLYAVVLTILNVRHATSLPAQQRVVIEQLAALEIAGMSVNLVEFPRAYTDPNNGLQRRLVSLKIGDTTYQPSEDVWINPSVDSALYRERYLQRYEFGWLQSEARHDLFVIETLQGEYALAGEPRAQLWLVSANGEVSHLQSVSIEQAKISPQWRAVFRVAHEPKARMIPALAALLVAMSLYLYAFGALFKQGAWGLFCVLVYFLVPVVAGSPLIASFGWKYLAPPLIIAFVVSAFACSAVASKIHYEAPFGWRQRLYKALIVPVFALFASAMTAISFASISILPMAGLGRDSPDDLFYQTLIRPTQLLLEGGLGVCMLLVFTSGLYRYMLVRKLGLTR